MPRLALLATGGTIAGTGDPQHYQAAVLGADTLFAGVPALREIADWHIEQIFQLDSRDLQPGHWLQLAERISALQADPHIDGIVITHGTDTLEETAFALHLLLPLGKPVVLTAAMRPSDAPDADGPGNLLQAAWVAATPAAAAHGVLVVANAHIIAGADLIKAHTSRVDALRCRAGSEPIGHASSEHIDIHPAQVRSLRHALPWPTLGTLPRVDILYGCAGVSADLPGLCITAGAQGLVLALSGHGSIPEAWRSSLQTLMGHGIAVVRATRITDGGVGNNCNEEDNIFGSLPAGMLSPQQARVLLILALAANSGADLRALFRRAGGASPY